MKKLRGRNRQETRVQMKNDRLSPEITSYDEEKLIQRVEILHFLFWLNVISETMLRTGKRRRSRVEFMDGRFGSWLAHAKYAALLLDSKQDHTQELLRVIGAQAAMKNKKFFINLGKCLAGEINPQLWDQRDIDMAEIVLFHPELSAGDAVRELERRDHYGITEENFRMWKMRLLKAREEYAAFRADEAYDLAHGK